MTSAFAHAMTQPPAIDPGTVPRNAPGDAPGNAPGPIAIVLKGYPRLSETFIAQEILALERRGFALRLISLRHPTDSKRHPVHAEIQAPVS